jgi:hypothetical protein
MKSVRFEKLIGKIGAMGLLLAFTGCTGHQGIPTEVITSVTNDPKGIEKWVLQESHEIKSPTHVVLALVSENGEIPRYAVAAPMSASFAYRSRFAKNILFIDTQSNKSSWLFSKNAQLIEEYFSFPRTNYSLFINSEKSEAKAIFYKVIDSDTNGDGKVTSQDNKSLAVSDTAGRYYKVIVKDISRVISIKEVGENKLMIVYQKAGVGYSLSLHFKGFTVLSNKMLPKVGE